MCDYIKYLTDNEIAIGDCDRAFRMAKELIEEGYAVCITREESLWILNYEYCLYSSQSNRNDIAFIARDALEMNIERYYSAEAEN